MSADSAEAARLRARLRPWQLAVCMCGATWVANGAAGHFVEAEWPAPAFLVTSLLLVVALAGRRRARRLLDLQVRRDIASAQRSSDAVMTTTIPLLYPTPAPESAQTARLKAQIWQRHRPVTLPLLIILVGSFVLMAADVWMPWSFIVLLLTLVPAAILGFDVRRRSERAVRTSEARDIEMHLAELKAEAARTPVAPVVYLRSFADDSRAGRRYGALTEEEQLGKALAWIGPLLAIGRPGEELPYVGAQRIYVANEEWQGRITELLNHARLVVLRTGSTEGFEWELERALTSLPPDRLLLVVDDTTEWRATLAAIARHAGHPLRRARLRGWPIGGVRGLVMFGPNWAPRPLRLPRGMGRSSGTDEPLVARFTLALRPLFKSLGASYQMPRHSATVVSIALVALISATAVLVGNLVQWLIKAL